MRAGAWRCARPSRCRCPPARCGRAASTAVASMKTMPAPPAARLPRWTRCQSLEKPSSAEYWHMGETPMRLRKVISRRVSGSRSITVRLPLHTPGFRFPKAHAALHGENTRNCFGDGVAGARRKSGTARNARSGLMRRMSRDTTPKRRPGTAARWMPIAAAGTACRARCRGEPGRRAAGAGARRRGAPVDGGGLDARDRRTRRRGQSRGRSGAWSNLAGSTGRPGNWRRRRELSRALDWSRLTRRPP